MHISISVGKKPDQLGPVQKDSWSGPVQPKGTSGRLGSPCLPDWAGLAHVIRPGPPCMAKARGGLAGPSHDMFGNSNGIVRGVYYRSCKLINSLFII